MYNLFGLSSGWDFFLPYKMLYLEISAHPGLLVQVCLAWVVSFLVVPMKHSCQEIRLSSLPSADLV